MMNGTPRYEKKNLKISNHNPAVLTQNTLNALTLILRGHNKLKKVTVLHSF